ncbi:hypothetical protein NMU03_15620 [Allocoprobacillus halotolerans]|uniref:DUF5590 domain-containing protein n=1 Tax=Allocoprobacillus halotolerans TaxID=2944914 RepID=A0ABY5I2N9_9FIRM|nr:hypothetical protein [Allocoprobacillus halotolerans]UTY38988.1 hypothetical protein NMU03_15620 [Allocoprobacillus halotolerans]
MNRLKKHTFIISVIVLVIILAVVSFYMLFVHVPYYQYHHGLDEIRNEICETNQYEYDDYFSEYRGKETYYIMKVKINSIASYVAYNKDRELVDTYQGVVALEKDIIDAIEQKYQVKLNELEVGYENERFVYYGRYQENESLLYVYYDLMTGEFIKAVRLG